jgi:Zn-dependent protease with chaperone function
MFNSNRLLIAGDVSAIAIVTLIGFATHGETGTSFLPRMAVLFFPLTIAWFILSPFVGLFQQEITRSPKQLWRPALAMFFAAPMAVVIRGLILNAPIIPIFAVVLSATSAFGILIWRILYFFINRKAHEER